MGEYPGCLLQENTQIEFYTGDKRLSKNVWHLGRDQGGPWRVLFFEKKGGGEYFSKKLGGEEVFLTEKRSRLFLERASHVAETYFQ